MEDFVCTGIRNRSSLRANFVLDLFLALCFQCLTTFWILIMISAHAVKPTSLKASLRITCFLQSWSPALTALSWQTVLRAFRKTIRFAPFSITFDEALTYRHRRAAMPFVIGPKGGSKAVNGLRLQIGSAYSLIRGGMSYKHRPISPHVTLVWDRIVVPKQPIKTHKHNC